MSIRYLLDTNTISYILKRRSQAVLQRLEVIDQDDQLCISSITEAELRYGYVHAGVGIDRFRALDQFLSGFEVLPWGRQEAGVYADLRTQQEKAGLSIAALDMLIVAHAISVRAVLVTHDSAMKNVRLLKDIEDWATDL